jgi:hypothetical protein
MQSKKHCALDKSFSGKKKKLDESFNTVNDLTLSNIPALLHFHQFFAVRHDSVHLL